MWTLSFSESSTPRKFYNSNQTACKSLEAATLRQMPAETISVSDLLAVDLPQSL